MDAQNPIYTAITGADLRLFQGELLSDLVRRRVKVETLGTPTPLVDEVTYRFMVVMTQDCDLEQDFRARQGTNKPDKLIEDVLCCQVEPASTHKGACGGSDIWKRIVQNKDERYHFLQKVESSQDAIQQGIVELGIDFKQHFTIPTAEFYQVIKLQEARRRCRLLSPYLEHLSERFAHFIGRVALPQEHLSEQAASRLKGPTP